jgi:uncharacterized protein YwgA
MDRRQVSTKLVLDELKIGVSMDSFHDRLINQKAIYLAQELGVDLGYYFRWYLRGPYCPALTTDLFSMIPELKAKYNPAKHWKLDNTSKERLGKLHSLIDRKNGNLPVKYLELLASVHFLISRRQVERDDAKEIQQTLSRYSKYFTLEEIKRAREDLKTAGFPEIKA